MVAQFFASSKWLHRGKRDRASNLKYKNGKEERDNNPNENSRVAGERGRESETIKREAESGEAGNSPKERERERRRLEERKGGRERERGKERKIKTGRERG